MTDPRDDKFWNEMADELRRALHLRPLTDDEAAAEYDAAPELPMSEEGIKEAIRLAKSRVPVERSYAERTGGAAASEELDQEVGEVLGLHRNEGELDPEVEEEMRRRREEALRDDKEDEDEASGDDDVQKS